MKLPVGTKNRWTTELHLLVAIVIAVTFTTAYPHGNINGMTHPESLLVVIGAIGLFMLVRYALPKKIERLFQRGKIDDILKYYRRTTKLSSPSELKKAYTRSLVLCFLANSKSPKLKSKSCSNSDYRQRMRGCG